ncbi:Ornithine cyclodeaminase [Lactococcus cremoris]|uniref:Ornithine cyclodeaminase n=2 Tax=Lactococcus lactis subsp. cremoris TaxID=1359 RepID=A0A161W232_LACLC|nr:Ornithine cyclodeaminase [Lactococcus cremoris]
MKILNSDSLKKTLKMADVIDITEKVYIQKSENKSVVWDTIFYDFEQGKADMDIKSGFLKSEKIFGHKTVTFFADNTSKNLPTLTGLINVFDSTTGIPLGITDGAYITGMRTGAASAIGAKYLANPNSENALIVGAGNQLIFQVAAILTVFPKIKTLFVYDRDFAKAQGSIKHLSQYLCDMKVKNEAELIAAESLESAVKQSQIIITITSSRTPFIKNEWITTGTHLSTIGADMSGKQEIEPEIFSRAIIYTDDIQHSSEVGEMELALKENIITLDNINGEIGELISGRKIGRTSPDEITIYDATGLALLDIATAKVALDSVESTFDNTFKMY